MVNLRTFDLPLEERVGFTLSKTPIPTCAYTATRPKAARDARVVLN
jgi:hypothetical protein